MHGSRVRLPAADRCCCWCHTRACSQLKTPIKHQLTAARQVALPASRCAEKNVLNGCCLLTAHSQRLPRGQDSNMLPNQIPTDPTTTSRHTRAWNEQAKEECRQHETTTKGHQCLEENTCDSTRDLVARTHPPPKLPVALLLSRRGMRMIEHAPLPLSAGVDDNSTTIYCSWCRQPATRSTPPHRCVCLE